jgi:hypothetical protein
VREANGIAASFSVVYSSVEVRMKGIEFLTDEKGERKAVVIDLAEHGELWEDVYDTFLAEERSGEPRESLSEVREKLLSTSGD